MLGNIISMSKIYRRNYHATLCSSSQRVSLIPQTMEEIATDTEHMQTMHALNTVGQKRLTLDQRKKKRRALDALGVPDFASFLKQKDLVIKRDSTTTFQMNVSLYCNQACNHCHVESSPKRREAMTRDVVDKCFSIIDQSPSIRTIDITGGAPELYSGFRDIVERARERKLSVIDRCNLTVLMEPGQEDLPEFLASRGVRVVASLPCYMEKNVNTQRGRGVYSRSIEGLKLLNAFGYGKEGSDLCLDLVYNPGGAFLPPKQADLEREYKIQLQEQFGIAFNNLLTLTNMPIKRFADMLYKANRLEEYMMLLVNGFNPAAVDGVMCKSTLSVGWDGALYDCDFNQQLQLAMGGASDEPSMLRQTERNSGRTVFDIKSVDDIFGVDVVLDNHCFGCTAGAGSSCGGSTVDL
jgi:radical SAM/Cys-rich protein